MTGRPARRHVGPQPGAGAATGRRCPTNRRSPSRSCRCCTTAGAICGPCATDAGSTSSRRGRSSTICRTIPASCGTWRRRSRRGARAAQPAIEARLASEQSAARKHRCGGGVRRRPRAPWRARLRRLRAPRPTEARARSRSEGQAGGIQGAQRRDAGRDRRTARRRSRGSGGAAAGRRQTRRRQFRSRTHYLGARVRRPRALARGGGRVRTSAREAAGDVEAWRALGRAASAQATARGASRAFEKLVALLPRDAVARMQLGEALPRRRALPGRRSRAISEALALDPKPAQYWNSLGTVLGAVRKDGGGASGRSREAADARTGERPLRLQPRPRVTAPRPPRRSRCGNSNERRNSDIRRGAETCRRSAVPRISADQNLVISGHTASYPRDP